MVKEVKVRRVGGSVGTTLPKDMADRLHIEPGDRLLAVETATLVILGVIAVISIQYSSEFFVDVLVIAILSVISSVAVAKYLVNGRPF